MADKIDAIDYKIMRELQTDANQPLEALAKKVGASKTPVWNRIRKLREAGVIKQTVAILDPERSIFPVASLFLLRPPPMRKDWQERFLAAVRSRPEVMEAHRLAGEIDYVLKIRVADAKAYDAFYQALISEVSIFEVTSTMSMEEIKATTALPI